MTTHRPEGVVLYKIEITHVLTPDGTLVDWALAEAVAADQITLVTILGMLRLAESNLVDSEDLSDGGRRNAHQRV